MPRLIRFFLYCFAVVIGVAGLLEGGIPLIRYATKRLEGKDYDSYVMLSPADRFSSEVILILSIILLIVIHIGHVLAGGLRLTNPDKSISPDAQARGPAGSSLKEPGPSTGAVAASAPDKPSGDEKLAHLIKPTADKSVS